MKDIRVVEKNILEDVLMKSKRVIFAPIMDAISSMDQRAL